mgnify:CR=1 FL=1
MRIKLLFIRVPPKPIMSKTPKISLSVKERNEHLLDLADAYADRDRKSRSEFFFSLVELYHLSERRKYQNA